MSYFRNVYIADPLFPDNQAIVTDHRALRVTPPLEAQSAFGEMLESHLEPEFLLSFVYGSDDSLVIERANQSGGVAYASSMASVTSGAAASSSGHLRSKRRLRYQPGAGSRVRFTALFTTGVANSTQFAGAIDESDGFAFGYNGTAFGILHRKNGSPEVRTLTLSAASSTTETITITLDGQSTGDVVNVTNSGVLSTTAHEIAAHDYSDVGPGWDAYAVGSTVVFVSWDATTHTGSYSLSSATTAAGTFAQTVAGVGPTDNWIPQASWNGFDIFDGTGLTGVTLDPTKLNVYQIVYQWLGAGVVRFFLEDPDDGELHLVHAIANANALTAPSVANPVLPFAMEAKNTSNTSNLTVKSASVGGYNDASISLVGVRRGVRHFEASVGATEVPIISLRNPVTFASRMNYATPKLLLVTVGVQHTKPVVVTCYRAAKLTTPSWAAMQTGSFTQVDTSASAYTGGEEQFSLMIGSSGSQIIDLREYYAGILDPGAVFTFTAVTASGTGADVGIGIRLVELP